MRTLVIFLVVIAAIAGGYYAYWHKKAADFRVMVVQNLDTLNTTLKPYTKDLAFIRYESANITGFPSGMVVELTKPVMNVPVSAMLQKLAPNKAAAGQAPFEWVEELSYGDKITLTGNLTGTQFTFTANGDRTHKSLVNRVARHTLISASATPAVCHLGVEQPKGETPWTMQPIFTDAATFFNIFRYFDCSAKGIALKDAATGTVLLTTDAASASFTNEPVDTVHHKLGLVSHNDKVKAMQAFDTILNDYRLMANSLLGQPNAASASIPLSEYGEQNSDIDAAYEGPISTKEILKPGVTIKADINSLEVHNALLNSSVTLHFNTAAPNNERSLSLSLHAKSNVSERYDALGQTSFAGFLKDMASITNGTPEDIAMSRKIAAFGSPEAIAVKVYPKMHDLGQTSLDIDLAVKGPNGAGIMRSGVVNLDAFNLLAEPYGIKIKGDANASVQGKLPSADFTLACLSCDALLTDLGNYAMRVESVADQFGNLPPYLSKDVVDGVKQFLHGLSENANSKDAVIHLVLKDTGVFTISGKQLVEVMNLFATTIAPHIRHSAVPNNGQAGNPAGLGQPQPSQMPAVR